MPAFRKSNDAVLGQSVIRTHRDWTKRNRIVPQYLQRALYPRKPILPTHRESSDETAAQPRRRNLSLWEIHAKTIQKREQKFRKEESRRIAPALPMAILNPPRSLNSKPIDNATIPSKTSQRSAGEAYEETPTEPDVDTRTEAATEIDEQTERDDAESEPGQQDDDRPQGDDDEKEDKGDATQRSLPSEKKEDLRNQAESFLRDVIGTCIPQVLKPYEGKTKVQENGVHLTLPQLRTPPEFVQGSSRDGQIGSEHQTERKADRVRDWLNSQSVSHSERVPDPTPVRHNSHSISQPSEFCIPIPMDTSPDLSDCLMDTSPDPEEIGVFTASDIIPPQPMRDVQKTSTETVHIVTSFPSVAPSGALPASFDRYRALSNPFATTHSEPHLNFSHPPTSSHSLLPPNFSPSIRGTEEAPFLYSIFDRPSHAIPGQNLTSFSDIPRSRPQLEQSSSASTSSAFDKYSSSSDPFLAAPLRWSSYSEPSSDRYNSWGQTVASQQYTLFERLSKPNNQTEEVRVGDGEREQETVEPFIIEACEKQEAWWGAIPEWAWAKSQNPLDFPPQSEVSALDVTLGPAHIQLIRRSLSIHRPSSFAVDTDDAARSLEGFDDLLEQRVNSEDLRKPYSSHIGTTVPENNKSRVQRRRKPRSPRFSNHPYRAPRSSSKQLSHQKTFTTPIRQVLDDIATAISRFPFKFASL